jgi:hypothetical protein
MEVDTRRPAVQIPHARRPKVANGFPRIGKYLERAIELPAAPHPRGSKLYIDGALSLLRWVNPDVMTLVSNPPLSLEKGCPNQLNSPKRYDTSSRMQRLAALARLAKDERWKLPA